MGAGEVSVCSVGVLAGAGAAQRQGDAHPGPTLLCVQGLAPAADLRCYTSAAALHMGRMAALATRRICQSG